MFLCTWLILSMILNVSLNVKNDLSGVTEVISNMVVLTVSEF